MMLSEISESVVKSSVTLATGTWNCKNEEFICEREHKVFIKFELPILQSIYNIIEIIKCLTSTVSRGFCLPNFNP